LNYKDFSKSKIIAFDIETKDPDLKKFGPAIRRGGYVLGVSLADETGFSEYYNLAHDDATGMERSKNLTYLANVFATKVPKLGQNILYDLDWIENFLKIKVNGTFHDVMVAEALIDENQGSYNLDFMAEKYLDRKKYKDEIDIFCEDHGLKGDSRAWLWKMDSGLVKKYAIGDVKLPLEIFKLQWDILRDESLLPLYHMEMELFPLLIYMREKGIRVNTRKLSELEERFSDELFTAEDQLNNIAGFEVNYNAARSIGKACDKFGIKYPLTEKTKQPSFQRPWLEKYQDAHPIFGLVLRCRKLNKLISTFLESQIQHQLSNGRIYGEFHPSKTQDSGTVTGRFSASHPNLQFIPNPEDPRGQLVRSLFLPEEDNWWGRIDYSQIEVRLLAHYAIGSKSDEIRRAFITDRNMDYHQWCAEVAAITRKKAKTTNFGIFYGMGVDRLCEQLGMERSEGEAFLNMYYGKLPFLRRTLYAVKDQAESRGFVKTILGRRRRFPNTNFTYKALNAIIQGSAADIMKKSMVDAWKAGIYNELLPLLTMHDEMDVSVPKTKIAMEAYNELINIMEQTVKLKVPILCDAEIGDSWGELMEYDPKQEVML
jgi:DNA polymerase-1